MVVFEYQALDRAATVVRGVIAADSPRDAREKLRAQGLVVELMTKRGTTTANRNVLRRTGRHAAQLALVIRDLATLLRTGIGLVDTLDTLVSQHRGALQASLSWDRCWRTAANNSSRVVGGRCSS